MKLDLRWKAAVVAAACVLALTTGAALAQSGPGVGIYDGTSIDAFGFDPLTISLHVGDTLTWINTGDLAHTVTAADGSFDSGLVNPGDTFSYTFASGGTYSYVCKQHYWMKATITVS
jgi:plastocyanin